MLGAIKKPAKLTSSRIHGMAISWATSSELELSKGNDQMRQPLGAEAQTAGQVQVVHVTNLSLIAVAIASPKRDGTEEDAHHSAL